MIQTTDNTRQQALGAMIEQARGTESVRSAASRAGVDEAMWRQVERGYRTVSGVRIPANPRDRNLEAIALAVGLDPADVFEVAGRRYTPRPPRPETGLAERVTRLEGKMDQVQEVLGQVLERIEAQDE